uniref:Uncharacterized protein n=1 Tax=Rhizophora mucronata TaxID=61149 RepID=A0A2P2QHA3_RHIMU
MPIEYQQRLLSFKKLFTQKSICKMFIKQPCGHHDDDDRTTRMTIPSPNYLS